MKNLCLFLCIVFGGELSANQPKRYIDHCG